MNFSALAAINLILEKNVKNKIMPWFIIQGF